VGLYRDYILPFGVDKALAGEEHEALRKRATSGLTGRVLEIGFGSGRNLAYLPEAVERVEAVEPAKGGRKIALPRIEACAAEVAFAGENAEDVKLSDGSVDSALSTWTLCTVPDPVRGLAEIRRLLVPGGRFHFLDHGLAPDPKVARWQRRLEPLQRLLFGGCRLKLPIDKLIREAGFEIESLETFYMAGPKISTFTYFGVARAD
jgi:SAM-dependent methyltransferase